MNNVILQAADVADVAVTATEVGSGLPVWVTWIMGAVVMAVGAFLVPYLKQLASKAKAEAEVARTASTEGSMGVRERLVASLKAFLLDSAAMLAEKNFPDLARNIQANGLKAIDIKTELRSWGTDIKNQAVKHFSDQGIDIIAAVGDEYLDKLIEWAANKVSPFPGRETAVALLQDYDGKAIELVLTKGIDWLRNKVLNDNAQAE